MDIKTDLAITDISTALKLGLSKSEYDHVCHRLERKPNFAELCIFSAMFSEHCSYKSSKKLLRRFPTSGKRVLQGPGENAGIVSISEKLAVAFKMESHNHPSFIEPFQGAATGVGGILRDIFTMGARPIANLNALCFGEPEVEAGRRLVAGVVSGISHYGNCVGVPMIGGHTSFHPCYNKNILVNAFTLGLVEKDSVFFGKAQGVGNPVVYVGAKTGRDGIHGASMASQEFSAEKEPDRPTVQVGDPFTEKLLLEATLEAMSRKLILGIQDMGAAGLTSSSFEMAERGKVGLKLFLDKIPTREPDLKAYELLLSESQERMLLVCLPEHLEELSSVYEKWGLHSSVIGEVTQGSEVLMYYGSEKVVHVPVSLVTEPLLKDLIATAPSDLKQRWFMDKNKILQASLEEKVDCLVSSPLWACAKPIYRQYDSMVQNRTETFAFEKGGVIHLSGTHEEPGIRLAVTVDTNSRICFLHPEEAGLRIVSESALNLACRGAEAIGLTDCLNFGNPENPEVFWQLERSIQGISRACEALKIPVVSGNVSLYNETDGKPIYPTPMVAMVGLIENEKRLPLGFFESSQLEIGLFGPLRGGLGGSLFSYSWFGRECGQPEDTDLTQVQRMLLLLRELQSRGFAVALEDVSEGGLILSLLEMAFHSPITDLGVQVEIPKDVDLNEFLFGETVPRVVCSYDSSDRTLFEGIASKHGITFNVIGETREDGQLSIRQGHALSYHRPLSSIKQAWQSRWERFF